MREGEKLENEIRKNNTAKNSDMNEDKKAKISTEDIIQPIKVPNVKLEEKKR